MLKPKRLTSKQTDYVLESISLLAQSPDKLNEDLQETEAGKLFAKDAKKFLLSSNIYQYELPELPNSKVILTEDVFMKLCNLAECSNYFEMYEEEFGGFLFGKEISPNVVLFHRTNDTESQQSVRAFISSYQMQKEIKELVKKEAIDYVCHVHTHPNVDELYSSTPSNQDLYVYAWLQENFQPVNKHVNYMGALISPTENMKNGFNDICFIYYDCNDKKFYKITDVSYISKENKMIPLKKELYEQVRNGNVESIENRTVLVKRK